MRRAAAVKNVFRLSVQPLAQSELRMVAASPERLEVLFQVEQLQALSLLEQPQVLFPLELSWVLSRSELSLPVAENPGAAA